MAESPNSTVGVGQSVPGQQSDQVIVNSDVPSDIDITPSGYVSPTFDLRAPAAHAAELHTTPVAPPVMSTDERSNLAAAAPGSTVQIGEKTIEIAPHPTTNRFPWAPVDNPTVPVYTTVPQPEPPQPVLMPVAEPTPLPTPEPAPQPESTPVETVELPIVPVAPPEPEETPLPATVATFDAKPEKEKRDSRIYSQTTRQVWHVLRPTKALKLLLLIIVILVISAGYYLWKVSDASLNSFHLPFMQQLIQHK